MDGLSDYDYSRQNNIIKFIHYAEYIVHMYLVYKCIVQGFSKSAFKGPNLNFHQCQRSGPEQLVITKLVFNKHSSLHNMHYK